MKKLLIFDLDGTLADTMPTLAEAMNRSLEAFSFPTVTVEKVSASIGNGMVMLCRRCVPTEFYDDESVYIPFVQKYKESYAQNYLNIDEPYNGLSEAVTELKERGYTLAALSNKPHVYTVDIVEKLFGKDCFSDIRGMMDGIPSKPDPTSFLDIASNLGFTAENTIMIGDSEPDLNVSQNAGAECISVTWGFRTAEQLINSGAKHLVERPIEILNLY